MHYWQTILEEVQRYSIPGYTCRYSNLQESDIYRENITECLPEISPLPPKQTYPLPPPLQHLYLTEREAECIYCLKQNHTIKSTSVLLNLSARTIEFYVKNIKMKLNVRTKSELMQRLQKLDFTQFNEIHDALTDLMQSHHTYLTPNNSSRMTTTRILC